MIRDYSKNYNDLTRAMKKLGTNLPDTMKGFTELHRASTAKGVLSTKVKELIALSIAITVRL